MRTRAHNTEEGRFYCLQPECTVHVAEEGDMSPHLCSLFAKIIRPIKLFCLPSLSVLGKNDRLFENAFQENWHVHEGDAQSSSLVKG